jgi:branched-chain amino acid transport system substrate-binding protein
VSHPVFPVGTTDFKSFVLQAKQAGASVVIAQMVPPDGIALWKQMKALAYTPQAAFCEKCGDSGAFPAALGGVANGTLTAGFWTSQAGLPDTAHIKATLGKTFKDDPDLSIAVWAYTAPKVLMDAIVKAGSTDPAKVQAALAATNATYPFAHIQFTSNNAATTPSYMEQWQGGAAIQVYPPTSAKLQFPAAGLK